MRAEFLAVNLEHTVLLYKSTGLQPLLLHLSLFAIRLNGLGRRRDLFWASLVNRVNGAVILFCAPQGFLRLVMRAGVVCSLPVSRADLFIKVSVKCASCKQTMYIVSSRCHLSCQYDENTTNSNYNNIDVTRDGLLLQRTAFRLIPQI